MTQDTKADNYWLERVEHDDGQIVYEIKSAIDFDDTFIVFEGASAKVHAERYFNALSQPVAQTQYSCGCVTCVCENDIQCQGCGAKACPDFRKTDKCQCGTPPQPAPEVVELEEAMKIVDGQEHTLHFTSLETHTPNSTDKMIPYVIAIERAARNWLHLQRQRGGV